VLWIHHIQYASQCLVRDCTNNRVQNTFACQTHQPEWKKYTKYRTCNVQSGIRRILQRPGETQAWNPQRKGQNLQDQSCQQIFYSFWRMFIKMRPLVLIIYALTKDVKFCKLLSIIEVGIEYESIQQELLLTLITILIIKSQITFAEHITILFQVMAQLQILLLLNMITMDAHMPKEHLILKYTSN
jgi:hypothetical protein